MGIIRLEMGKVIDKMRQDVATIRHMRDVPSVFTPPGGAQNARGILHVPHLAAILSHLVAHLVHLKPTYAHLGSS